MRVRTLVAGALAATLLFAAGSSGAATVYGAGVDLPEATPLGAIVGAPGSWLGETVKVEGVVVEVCAARGCWLELGGGEPPATLRVKVDDGVIVFPLSARGRRATVQGAVERVGGGDYPGRGREGRGVAESHPVAGTIQIRATGAVIE